MADVVGLHGVAPLRNEPVAGVIDKLEETLERARKGEIRAIGLAVVLGDLGARSRIAASYYAPAGSASWAVECAARLLMREIEKDGVS